MSTLADTSPRLTISAPLADQVMARLEETLKSHPPGRKLPSERQIASQLGVSRVTVREALLRLESDGRIHRHVGRGTFVAEAPPAARAPALAALGLWVVGYRRRDVLSNPYFGDMLLGFEAEVARRGGDCVLSLGDPADHETGLPPMISEGRVAAALLIGAASHLEPAAWAVLRRMPFITCGRSFQGQKTNRIAAADAEGVGLAMRHLWNLGHRRIGFAGLDAGFSDYKDRADAYETFMRERGAFVPGHKLLMPYHTPADPSPLLKGPGRPTAILAVHDGLAATSVLAAARQAGLSVPHDLSIVGFADTIGAAATPPLTTVWFDKVGMGAEAARQLLAAMEQGRVDIESAVFPVKLVERASCAPPGQ